MNKKSIFINSPMKMMIIAAMISIVVAITNIGVFAVSDGAYTTGLSTSYAHPYTGKIMDGGTNLALGDGMVKGIVEKTALVEKVGNKTYVTIGLGLSSAVSNFKVYTEHNGKSVARSVTKTGSFAKDGDRVTQYRFEISNLNDLISPEMFVSPMGRNVKFFIKLNGGDLSPGTGAYKALMVPKTPSNSSNSSSTAAKTEEKKDDKKSDANKDKDGEEKDAKSEEAKDGKHEDESNEEAKDKEKEDEKSEAKSYLSYAIGGVVIVIVVAGGVTYYIKGKK